MDNFAAVRIDDRLIHGQIVATWINALGVRSIIVADDKAATDELQKMLLSMAVPKSIKFEILPIDKAAARIQNPDEDMERTLFIVRNIEAIQSLMNLGITFNKVNFGNAGSAKGRVQYFKSVWLTDDERKVVEDVMAAGVEIEVQVVPTEKALNMKDLLK